MHITYTQNAHVLDVVLKGRFTLKSADDFRKIFDAMMNGVSIVHLHFAEVEFIDSVALGLMLLLREQALPTNIELKILSPSGQPARMLAVSKMNTLFTIVESAPNAG
jgi:anti-anti-sigma factor